MSVATIIGRQPPALLERADWSSGRLGPLRPAPDHFEIGEIPGPALHNQEAERIAEAISITMGEHHAEIDEYIGLLGYAPVDHLAGLRRRGARIFFAPTVAHYLLSTEANRRRVRLGYPMISSEERASIAKEYGPGSSVIAVYDSQSDALVLPYLQPGPDKLRALLHEMGHAVTFHQLAGREADFAHVLRVLPKRIREHLQCGYSADLAVHVHESFAEAYAMLVCERVAELGVLASDLVGILNCVHERPKPPKDPRWKLDLTTGRSTSLATPSTVEPVGPMPDLDEPLPVRPTAEARDAKDERAA